MRKVMKDITLNKLTVYLVCIFLFSCTDDTLNPPPYEPKETEIDLSGIWLLSGSEERTTYSEWPIPPDEDPEQEKYSQGFNVLIQQIDENNIRIYGLVGADAGRAENAVFPECSNPENCKVFGTKTGEHEWEIDIQNGPRTYNAVIKLKEMIDLNEFTLEGTYEYQNKSIEYVLDGRRIPE